MGSGAAPAMLTVTDAEASSTDSVPGALDLAAFLPPLSEPPPEAPAMPKAAAKATTTTAATIAI